MTKEAIRELNEVSVQAVAALKEYFQGARPEDKNLPDRALTLLGRVNGMESTRLQAIALQFQIAKHVGLKGEPLRPLLVELNPENFASAAVASIGPAPESKESSEGS